MNISQLGRIHSLSCNSHTAKSQEKELSFINKIFKKQNRIFGFNLCFATFAYVVVFGNPEFIMN